MQTAEGTRQIHDNHVGICRDPREGSSVTKPREAGRLTDTSAALLEPPNTAGSCTKAFSVSDWQSLGSALLDEAVRGQKGNSGITLETAWRRFGPIGAEELGRKWITVQTDRSGQPPGLVSRQRSSPRDRGSPELQVAPRFFYNYKTTPTYQKTKREMPQPRLFVFQKMAGWSLAARGRSSLTGGTAKHEQSEVVRGERKGKHYSQRVSQQTTR